MPPVQDHICVKKHHFRTPISSCVKIKPFQDHHFRSPISRCVKIQPFQDLPCNMAWQICQQLTTANLINKTLVAAKYQTPGTKLYIRTAPLESKCIKKEPRREFKSQTLSRSPSSDSDNRQSCPVKTKSCRSRSPNPTHTGTPPATQDTSQKS